MGCIHSANSNSGSTRGASDIKNAQRQQNTNMITNENRDAGPIVPATAAAVAAPIVPPRGPPNFLVPDPDLGWRHKMGFARTGGLTREDSEGVLRKGEYPEPGFWNVAFMNERSNVTINKVDIVVLALNIAGRTEKLANKFGVTEINAAELMEDSSTGAWSLDPRSEALKVLKFLGCPDFGWVLSKRKVPLDSYADAPLPPEIQERRASLPRVMQEFTKQGRYYLVDVAEIAMNMAEQLFRLEKADIANTGARLPTDTFGWRIGLDLGGAMPAASAAGIAGAAAVLPPQDTRTILTQMHHDPTSLAIPVASPDCQAMYVVPEELIMNVASWIQQTYLTSPVF